MDDPYGIRLRRSPQSTGTLTVEDLEVNPQSGWLPLVSWLDGYVRIHQDTSYTQADWWWIARGQTFRFLDLPAELRVMVYENIIGRYIWPRRSRRRSNKLCVFHVDSPNRRKTNAIPRSTFGQYWFDPVGDRLPRAFAMPLVSRQVRDEFVKVLWENTYKHYNCLHDCFYRGLTSDVLNLNFRRISLGFTNPEHFAMVGVRVGIHGGLSLDGVSPIKEITANTALEHLNLHFQVSPYGTYLADPWAGRSCQKTLVDWILTAALTQMDRVPNITLSGHVKHSTRRKWEAIFEDEQKGIKHDMTAPMARILATPRGEL